MPVGRLSGPRIVPVKLERRHEETGQPTRGGERLGEEGGRGGMRILGLVLAAGVLSACASSLADPSLDAAAKLFHAPADKACIYVIPSSSDSSVAVTLDGRKVGTLTERDFLRLEVAPGRHLLYVTPTSLVPEFSRATGDDVTLDAEMGRCYFLRTVWTEFGRSWRRPRVYLERTTEEEGQRAVNVRSLVVPAR
jgi:hypothetical protein